MDSGNKNLSGGIGILGGTFDPVHLGHIAIASAVRDHYNLSVVFLIPAFKNPLRMVEDTIAGPEHRLNMLKLAVADEEGLDVDPIEIENGLKSGEPSYTIHTLEHLKSRYPGKRLMEILANQVPEFLEKHSSL